MFGSAAMGYGDLFIAGVLGGLLATRLGRVPQVRAAVLTAALALAFDLLFFVVEELPATVPVALTLIVLGIGRPSTKEKLELGHGGRRRPPTPARAGDSGDVRAFLF